MPCVSRIKWVRGDVKSRYVCVTNIWIRRSICRHRVGDASWWPTGGQHRRRTRMERRRRPADGSTGQSRKAAWNSQVPVLLSSQVITRSTRRGPVDDLGPSPVSFTSSFLLIRGIQCSSHPILAAAVVQPSPSIKIQRCQLHIVTRERRSAFICAK